MGIFNLETLLVGEQFKMVNYPQTPLAAFNPAACIKNNKLVILPRLYFDTHFYVSSVGLCEPLEFDKLSDYNLGAKTIETKLLKYPKEDYEIRGVEDPRITEDGSKILTVGVSFDRKSQTILSDFDGDKITSSKPFFFKNSIINTGKDAVLLNNNVLLFRPEAKSFRTYRAYYTVGKENVKVSDEGLRVFTEFDACRAERKRGLSTNAVKIDRDLSVCAYHSVLNRRVEYREGFVLFDTDGDLMGMTDGILGTSDILRYGYRPYTLFGCGLVLFKNRLYFVGGVGDSWIGVFSAKLDDVMGEINESFI